MSLRSKILLLFLVLAIAPLIVVAGSAYVQSQRALEDLMERRVETLAGYAAQDLDNAYSRIESQLGHLGSEDPFRRLLLTPAGAEPDPAVLVAANARMDALWPYLPEGLVSIAIRGPAGELLYRGTTEAAGESLSCGGRPWSGTISVVRDVRADPGEPSGQVRATIRADAMLRPEVMTAQFGSTGLLAILDRTTATTILLVGCQPDFDAAILLSQSRGTDGRPISTVESGSRFTYRDGGATRLGTFISLRTPPWTVVVTGGTNSFLEPFRDLQRGYALFVALIALSTALAFSRLINSVMRSLADLGDAADRIGQGELDPWLPPPSQDEVGRLSHAIGRMAERIREMMRQVDRSSRMAVVGELASYLAHEIRNPLSSIKLNLQSLARDLERGSLSDDPTEEIQICLREVGRLERVVSSVLRLGKAPPGQLTRGSVHALLEETITLIQPELNRYGITAHLDLNAPEHWVNADFAQLKGVFLNLFLNAIDAMREGGNLSVSTANTGGAQGRLVIQVSDDGPGLSQELRERIFEPFFTTKPDGSGIGLSLAARAVEDHGGRIYLEPPSGIEQGAAFTVELPLRVPGRASSRDGTGDDSSLPSREVGLLPKDGPPEAGEDSPSAGTASFAPDPFDEVPDDADGALPAGGTESEALKKDR